MSAVAPAAGLRAELEYTVAAADTAAAVGSGSLPVLSTPTLAAMMEKTAVKCLDGCLEPGATSVGTLLELHHLAAVPVGARVRCAAQLCEVQGRRMVFELCVSDAAGTLGTAKHERFLVDAKKFMAKAESRRQAHGND